MRSRKLLLCACTTHGCVWTNSITNICWSVVFVIVRTPRRIISTGRSTLSTALPRPRPPEYTIPSQSVASLMQRVKHLQASIQTVRPHGVPKLYSATIHTRSSAEHTPPIIVSREHHASHRLCCMPSPGKPIEPTAASERANCCCCRPLHGSSQGIHIWRTLQAEYLASWICN